MAFFPRRTSVAAAVAILLGAALLSHLGGWPQAGRTLEFTGLLFTAILVSPLRMQHAAALNRAVMPPSFVVTIVALLLFGPGAALCAAAVAVVMSGFSPSGDEYPRRAIAVETVVVLSATAVAGLGYQGVNGVLNGLPWSWQALPIAAAAVGYHLAQGTIVHVVQPLVTRRAIDRAWPKRALRGASAYLLGASVAAGLVAAIHHQAWDVLTVAAVPVVLAYRMYADSVTRLETDGRVRQALDSLDQGLTLLDGDGRVTLWSDALERMLDCPRERALGRPVAFAVPLLAKSELPRAVQEALAGGKGKTLDNVPAGAGAGARILQVQVHPAAGGASLVWRDVTDRAHAEREMKQAGERLALAAEGANDGLWQWDLRSREFFVSGRWRAMVGLPADSPARAEDWLDRVHAEDLPDLKATLDAHLAGHTEVFQHEHRLRHEDGSYRRFLCRGVAAPGLRGRRDRIAGSLTDTTEHAITRERLRSVGFLDPLTGLFNRAIFVEGLGRQLEEFRLRGVNSAFAVLYLDLDRFKIVNDSLGHLVGDELLVAASRRLESCLRLGDALARLGGDEFAILLNGLGDDAQANAIAFRIQEALSAPFSIGGREVFTSASIGIAFGPAHYTNPDEIMRDADTAMYHAKSRGKARHEVFDADMHARVRDRLTLENDLRRAVAGNDFEVHYQPIVLLTSGMCVGFESLVRWTRNGEAISPAVFVPIAEELGLIETLGTWVLQQACETFAGWQRRFPEAELDCITVNVSSRQLMQQNFLRVVQQAVRTTGLKPADLRVEITETALMDSPGEAAGVLRDLRDFGVKVYLDDFGTGYSSLSHLHKLPVDALKIDRSFVKSLLLPDRPAIVESILALARTLNTSVVAEGIESEVQARELERLGCTHAQGFLFSRPLSVKAAEALVAAHQPLGPKGAAGPEAEPAYPQPRRLALRPQPSRAAGEPAPFARA